jgi:hypothetical protein
MSDMDLLRSLKNRDVRQSRVQWSQSRLPWQEVSPITSGSLGKLSTKPVVSGGLGLQKLPLAYVCLLTNRTESSKLRHSKPWDFYSLLLLTHGGELLDGSLKVLRPTSGNYILAGLWAFATRKNWELLAQALLNHVIFIAYSPLPPTQGSKWLGGFWKH